MDSAASSNAPVLPPPDMIRIERWASVLHAPDWTTKYGLRYGPYWGAETRHEQELAWLGWANRPAHEIEPESGPEAGPWFTGELESIHLDIVAGVTFQPTYYYFCKKDGEGWEHVHKGMTSKIGFSRPGVKRADIPDAASVYHQVAKASHKIRRAVGLPPLSPPGTVHNSPKDDPEVRAVFECMLFDGKPWSYWAPIIGAGL